MAKVDIISGFLGAGKTTLIRKLVSEAFKGQQVVLIENEFGEIAIDGGFLKDAGIEITEMSQGCICCSLVGDFGKALKDVITKFNPDRVLIEPSGVGKLSDVAKAVQRAGDDVPIELNSMVTVADVNKCKMYLKNFGEFYSNQVESADTIVLSRTQKVSPEKLEQAVALLREHNKDARIITTPWDELTGAQILSAIEHPISLEDLIMAEDDDDDDDDECCCGHDHHDEDEHEHEHHHHHDDEDEHEHEHHHHHDDEDEDEHEHHHHHDEEDEHDHEHHHHHHGHDADEIFTSWGTETPRKYTKEEIESILKALSDSTENEYGIVLRSKGMLPAQDGTWIYFDMVPEEFDIREGSPEYTGRLCVIGSKLDEDKLEKLFLLK